MKLSKKIILVVVTIVLLVVFTGFLVLMSITGRWANFITLLASMCLMLSSCINIVTD